MIDDILELIATKSPFGADTIKRAYDMFKSIDIILRAVEYCSLSGSSDLIRSCRMIVLLSGV